MAQALEHFTSRQQTQQELQDNGVDKGREQDVSWFKKMKNIDHDSNKFVGGTKIQIFPVMKKDLSNEFKKIEAWQDLIRNMQGFQQADFKMKLDLPTFSDKLDLEGLMLKISLTT